VAGLVIVASACGQGAPQSRGPSPQRPPSPSPSPDSSASPEPSPSPDLPTTVAPKGGKKIPLRRAAWVDGLPPLMVANGSEVQRHRSGDATLIGGVSGTAAVAFAAGSSVVVEAVMAGDRSRLIRLGPGGRKQVVDAGNAQQIRLHDVALIDGEHRILLTTYVGDENTARSEDWGYLYVQEIDGPGRRRVTVAYAPEFGIGRASYGGGVIVTSATADLTESFEFFRPNGSPVKGLPNPTDDLEYNQPPYMSDAVFSPDGKWLAYLEGPDTSFDSPEKPVGRWVAVVLNQKTGRERLRVEVAKPELCVSWVDFDGRWLVFSRTTKARGDAAIPVCGVTGVKPLRVLALDTESKPLELVELTNVAGVATIDS
jgi:hypothetical protein